jgi:hypothetical protein
MLFSAPILVLDQDQCLEMNAKDVQYVHFREGNRWKKTEILGAS